MHTQNTLHSHRQKETPKASFSFMADITHAVAFLTKEQIISAASSDGMVLFQRSMIGKPKLLPMGGKEFSGQTSDNIVALKVDTVLRRAGLLPQELEHTRRKDSIEKISLGERGKENFDNPTHHKTRTESNTIGNILRSIRNSFRNNDLVEQVDELHSGDRMFLHFQDDSQAYSISVRDSSKMVGGQSRALCNITYATRDPATGERKEVSQE